MAANNHRIVFSHDVEVTIEEKNLAKTINVMAKRVGSAYFEPLLQASYESFSRYPHLTTANHYRTEFQRNGTVVANVQHHSGHMVSIEPGTEVQSDKALKLEVTEDRAVQEGVPESEVIRDGVTKDSAHLLVLTSVDNRSGGKPSIMILLSMIPINKVRNSVRALDRYVTLHGTVPAGFDVAEIVELICAAETEFAIRHTHNTFYHLMNLPHFSNGFRIQKRTTREVPNDV